MSVPRKSTRNGFTLIEMVTSLSIVSVLLIGLSTAVMLGSQAIPSSLDSGKLDQRVMNAIDQFRSDLREAVSIQVRDNGTIVRISIEMGEYGDGSPKLVQYQYDGDEKKWYRKADSETAVETIQGVNSFVWQSGEESDRLYSFQVLFGVDQTIQRFFELHAVLPYRPEVKTA